MVTSPGATRRLKGEDLLNNRNQIRNLESHKKEIKLRAGRAVKRAGSGMEANHFWGK